MCALSSNYLWNAVTLNDNPWSLKHTSKACLFHYVFLFVREIVGKLFGLKSLKNRLYLLMKLIKLAQCIPFISINDSERYNCDNRRLIVYQWVVTFGLMRLLLLIVFRPTVKVMHDYDL